MKHLKNILVVSGNNANDRVLFAQTIDLEKHNLARLTVVSDEFLLNYPVEDQGYLVHRLKGNAGKLIPELVQDNAIDLIVMGTVYRTDVSGLHIGATAESILHCVDCSVLAVKPDGFVTPVGLGTPQFANAAMDLLTETLARQLV